MDAANRRLKFLRVSAVLLGLALALSASSVSDARVPRHQPRLPVALVANRHAIPAPAARKLVLNSAAATAVVQRYCTSCHNPKNTKGNLILEGYDVDSAAADAEKSEKMIRKMRAGIMPPPGSRRPAGDTLVALMESLEGVMDKGTRRDPGIKTFQRLNRPEYEHAVRDLVGVTIDAGDFLPLDTKSANFDNIADVQQLSLTLLESYLNAAGAVSRIAIGDRTAANLVTTYESSGMSSQHPWDHIEGTPFGTRGGVVADHPFPSEGTYTVRVNIQGGVGARLEDIDVSIDGVRVALLRYERGVSRTVAAADNPQGADYLKTEPIHLKAGQQRVTAAWVRRTEGPYEDLIKPHEWSAVAHGGASTGTTTPPHVKELTILGPEKPGATNSDSPSRKMIFTCRPATRADEAPCARQIITRLATKAYRRPLTERDVNGLMAFYTRGSKAFGFDEGIRTALQAILASPYFVFRFENAPAGVAPGSVYKISDYDLASRLSFFLWGSIPDDQLIALARAGTLSQPATLNAQVKRMLADPRSEALATRFAAQWLRLQDVEKVRPEIFYFPDYDLLLAKAMVRETELFFNDLVQRDRSFFELFTADYTFVNERLAKHYGFPDVSGNYFRRVSYPDTTRRGLLGHGSVLVQTSLADRTSPVLRGKWVMQVIIGAPPPAPPPDVPPLEETADSKDGKPLTTRQRTEIHRRNPTCNACHQYMDPIGLSLDHFDVTGRWRYRENGMELDTQGRLFDGTSVSSLNDLNRALLRMPLPLARSFAENLMAFATGRRMEDFDQPTIRAITKQAEANGYKLSSFVMGVVNSPAFRSRRAETQADLEGR